MASLLTYCFLIVDYCDLKPSNLVLFVTSYNLCYGVIKRFKCTSNTELQKASHFCKKICSVTDYVAYKCIVLTNCSNKIKNWKFIFDNSKKIPCMTEKALADKLNLSQHNR